MVQLLGLTLLSMFFTAVLIVPFIDFLYKKKLRRHKQNTVDMFNKPTPVFDKYNQWKVGTPFGGGALIIIVVCILSLWSYGILNVKVSPWEIFVLIFSIVSFGALGFYDDLKKLVDNPKKYHFGSGARNGASNYS